MLVIGIGNPGRQDDGLGAEAVRRLEAHGLPGVTCQADYQLGLEDALACSKADIVVFIDAARDLKTPFTFEPAEAASAFPPMTHTLSPGAVLAVTSTLYGRTPKAFLLGIRGHRWGLGEGLSAQAERDLEEALDFLLKFLKEGER